MRKNLLWGGFLTFCVISFLCFEKKICPNKLCAKLTVLFFFLVLFRFSKYGNPGITPADDR